SLGGLRKTRANSVNLGWRNASFRGFADYMQTDEFRGALQDLIDLSQSNRIAIMCAEAVPWRCHRSLIADALMAKGIEVLDIMDANPPKVHQLGSFAKVEGGEVTYPANEDEKDG